MSDYKPITGELREYAEKNECKSYCKLLTDIADRIDAIHAGLERENAELRERLAKMDNRGDSMHIAEATVTITPTLDWSGVAQELRAIADTLAGDAE